jgi:hypothetical protein
MCTQGACIYCDKVTEDQERGFDTDYQWVFVCRECSSAGNSEPFAADFR